MSLQVDDANGDATHGEAVALPVPYGHQKPLAHVGVVAMEIVLSSHARPYAQSCRDSDVVPSEGQTNPGGQLSHQVAALSL